MRKLREKGKLSLSRYFQEFEAGEMVNLKINSNVQKGQFFRRFHGMTGMITGKKKGFSYEVKIKDLGKEKTLYIYPIHLQKA